MDIKRWHGPLVRTSDWAWRILVVLALGAVVVWAGISLAAIVIPALLAVVIIPVGRPLVERLERRLPSAVAAALVLLLALLILVAAGWLMVASIAANWQALWDGLAGAVTVIVDWIDVQIEGLEDSQVLEIRENLRDLVGTVSAVLIGGATRSVAILGSLLVGTFLFVVTLYFGLRDWPKFQAWLVRSTHADTQQKAEAFMGRFDVVLRNYWKGQALIGLFGAVALGLGLWLIGVPLAAPIAVLTFVISFIPYVGATVSTALAVFVALGTSGIGDATLALLLALFIFNTGENLMRPWLVGETIKLPTFVVFIASTVGVLLAGALGAVLAIPVVALVGEAQRIFMGGAEEAVAETP
ncbi:MAG: AI-2E family transporter [Acidimicrobiia bacterium]|nr:AI-2E family transporter [Acidimicrobiia bacterium]